MRLTLFLVVGLVGGSTPALSESNPPRFEETLLVTAAVEPVRQSSTPASTTVIEAEQIAARQATEVLELLASVAGLHTVQSGGAGQAASLFTRGTESDHTLVLLDGVPLNNPYFGGFNWAFLPTEGLERIEIVRGPYSALYGSDALGAIVQLVGANRDGGSLQLEGGSNDYLRSSLQAGRGWGPLRVDLSGHLRRGAGELDNSFFDGEELRLRATWQATPAVSVGLWSRLNDSTTGIPLSLGQPTPNREISWQEKEVGLPLAASLGEWKIDALFSEVRYDSTFEDPDDPFGFTYGKTESKSRRGRVSASREAGQRGWLAMGTEFERHEVSDRSSFGPSLEAAAQRTVALFGQSRYRLGPVTLDAGFRYDDNDVYGSQTSPRLGALAELAPGLLLRTSYGEGFRAPSLGELFYPFSGNPELEPESSTSWEAGVEVRRGTLRLVLTTFRNEIEQLIDFDFATFKNVNIGEARTQGLEVELDWTRDLLQLRGQLSLLDAEDLILGEPLLRRPDTQASLGFTLHPADWTIDLQALYVGERPDIDPVTFERTTNPSYLRFDLAARWQALERFSPYARIQNLSDEPYEEALGFPAPGRSFVGGVELSF